MQNSQISLDLENQTTQISNMCMSMGIQKWSYVNETRQLSHMPVSLYPYQISEATYQKLKVAHLIWAQLILKISKDVQFVNKVFNQTVKSDEFVKRILQLYNKYAKKETIGVTCLRVDYMGDQSPELVEFNLISVGLNGISDQVQRLMGLKRNHRTTQKDVSYPINHNQVTLVNAIETVLQTESITGIIVMVVHEKNQKQFNFGDQMAFQIQVLKRGLKVVRVSMTEFIAQYQLRQNSDMFLNDQKVAVVYFRTAYSPTHYTSENHWKLRQDIERANVLSFPTISMQLVNFKRMQVQLSKIQVLRKYLSEDDAQLIKSLNGQIYDFEDSSKLGGYIQLARTGNYVLKTNRQGGGNNYFGNDVVKILSQLESSPSQLCKYILMNKIPSTIAPNIFIANYKYAQIKQTTCQMSTFGTFAYKQNKMLFNQYGGNLIRLKRADENQGGIAIDKAVISGICVLKN